MPAHRRLIGGAILLAAVIIAALAILQMIRARRAHPAFTVTAVRLPVSGYTLSGDLYRPRSSTDAPVALLFLHGSNPRGGRLALYPALCERLAARGYTVVNLNQRGYAGSEGPAQVHTLEDLDYVGDAREAARRLPELLGESPREIVLAGHSFGGGVAVVAGLTSPAVNRVISISPGRRLAELFTEARPDRLAYVQRRRSRDLRLAEPIPIELILPLLASYDVEQFRGQTLPKPLLFVEGAREPADDLAFTRDLVSGLRGDVAHVVLPDAHHYFGASVVETGDGKEWAVTHPDILDRLVEALDRWLRGDGD